jgi:nondiscriminating glutamyl-tRNA synthetase
MRLRFAPSPTGRLHVGNARTALFNWLLARGHGGTFVLRIEDTDAERSTEASEAGILDDLRWLGLGWDEGPDVGGDYGPYRQSERLETYARHASELLARDQAYYCFCSSEQLEKERRQAHALGLPAKYSGRCRTVAPAEARRRVEQGEPAAVRFKVEPGRQVGFDDRVRGHVSFSTDVIGDPVIVRSEGRPAYNFAVVVDDGLMAITHVIRGEDHVSNTPRQLLIYEALGFTPPEFAHLSLVMGPDHTPLSKRHGATSVAEFRARGYLPEALCNYLALIGWSPGDNEEILPIEELARRFSLEAVGRSAGVFAVEKLAWVNRHYMKAAPADRVGALVAEHLQRAGLVGPLDDEGRAFVTSLVPLVSGAVDRLDQAPERLRFLFAFDARATLSRDDVRAELAREGPRQVVRALAEELATSGRVADRVAFRELVERVTGRTGQKGRALFHPVRVALTGENGGPELDLAVPAIERGADLPASSGVGPIRGCRERAASVVDGLEG